MSSTDDLATLRTLFRANGRDLVVSEGVVFEIPCSGLRIAGASEASETRGHGENSQVAGRSEDSKLAGQGEHSRVAAAGENSKVAAAGEASHVRSGGEASEVRHANEDSTVRHAGEDSKIAHAGEDSDLAAKSSRLSCVRLGKSHYKVFSESASPHLRVWDGAMFVEVAADGTVR